MTGDHDVGDPDIEARTPRGQGNIRRPGGSDHPHDPRRPGPGMPRKDERKPAGDESVTRRNDDVPDIDDKSRAPIPGLPDVKRPKPVD